jgi:IS30 family transposase
MAHLRTARQMRQAKGGTTKNGLGQIVDAISIRERPAEVEDRAVPGHWEGDLLSGANNTHIATLVERHTRFVMLLKIPSKDTATVVAALARHVRKLPSKLRRSLTWDRGKEMADHKRFTIPPTCRFISAIHAVPGSAAATRTPMACCGSISRRGQISRSSLKPT